MTRNKKTTRKISVKIQLKVLKYNLKILKKRLSTSVFQLRGENTILTSDAGMVRD